MKMKSKILIVGMSVLSLIATTLFAQSATLPTSGGDSSNGGSTVGTPVTGGSSNDGASSVQSVSTDPVVDLSAITNHAELVSREFKKVQSILVTVSASASADPGPMTSYYPFTNSVKTLEDAEGLVTNNWYGIKIVDTNSTISFSVQFFDTNDEYTVRNGYTGNDGYPIAKVLFQGFNGGTPTRNQYGQLVMPDYAQTMTMQMTYDVFINATDIVSARLLYTNVNGQWLSMTLSIDYGKGFHYPPDFAGQGIIVLGFWKNLGNNNYSYSEHAYSLYNGGQEVQMEWVFARAILADSDDFRTSVNQTNLTYDIYSYQGFGKVPLLTPTYTGATNKVYLSVFSSQLFKGDGTGQAWATAYRIENLETKQVSTEPVPVGAIGMTVTLKKGKYHIVPIGLNLKPWVLYGWYGGKG